MGDPLFFAKALQYYKRREVQEAIVRHAVDREVSPRYGEGFGKRPDVLSYPTDVLEFAKRKCTSFHVSEERWESVLSIKTGATRKEQDDLRKGWDLVLDIDAPDWDVSRLTAWLFVESLKAHGVRSISVKFSGNKGWHIGVPFESFPTHILDTDGKRDLAMKNLFPDMPRAVAGYLLEYMGKSENGLITIDNDTILFGWDPARAPAQGAATHLAAAPLPLSKDSRRYPLAVFAGIAKKEPKDLIETYCPSCDKAVERNAAQYSLDCANPACQYRAPQRYTREEKGMLDDKDLVCPKCHRVMDLNLLARKAGCTHSPAGYQHRLRLGEVIQVDTVLLASRHLYRMAYSLHEKSGLASVVVPHDHILDFDKTEADPKTISFDRMFLDPAACTQGDAEQLAKRAWEWRAKREEASAKRSVRLDANGQPMGSEFEDVTETIPETHFPPCMRNILAGMKDGKKRAMFALTNFMGVCGWTPDAAEARLHVWNTESGKLGDPLREVAIKGHMRTVRMKKERIMPPNCKSFYQDLGVCKPDDFCSRVRNPAQYAIRHSQLGARRGGRKKAVKEDGTMNAKTAAAVPSPDDLVQIGKGKVEKEQNAMRHDGQEGGDDGEETGEEGRDN
ncbi:TPA: hypothetical protein HA251_07185 [Candidatus Woesearchaeota archaeon]|nr:hypothetical protein [Candidatus Woesearchaeota archaeon]